jgi:hypothetical protein
MKLRKLTWVVALAVGGITLTTHAQTTSVLSAGLDHPTKIITAAGNSLLVAEGGTMTANTGRISVIDRVTGTRHTLIDGLPSGVSNLGGTDDTDGTTGIYLKGNVLYVTSGVGDAVINVGPGLELPNPTGPSSPIFNSVIEITLPGGYASLGSGFSMTLADQAALADYKPVVLKNSRGQSIAIRMIADLPDYRPEERPGAPDNVRASHLFGLDIFQKKLYVVDAGFNLIHRIDTRSGSASTFVNFPNKPNPLFPGIGGPVIEAVPDNIHRVGSRLIVPLLTGFPFVPEFAEVQSISLRGDRHETLIPGLTSAIDVLLVETAGADGYFVLEFSADQLGGLPGRLQYFSSANAAPETVVPVVITPTSMARDEGSGDIFITNIFPGTVTRVQFP